MFSLAMLVFLQLCFFLFWAYPHKFFFSSFLFLWEYFWAAHAWQFTLGLFLLSYVYFAYSSNDIMGLLTCLKISITGKFMGPWRVEYVELLFSWDKGIRPWRPHRLGLLGLAIFIPPWDKSFDGHLLSVKDIYTYQSIRAILFDYIIFFLVWKEIKIGNIKKNSVNI